MFVCKHLVRFFEKHAQNLNTPQNNSASWDLQMGFNLAFKGLIPLHYINKYSETVNIFIG
jgi:hypothetical protein